MAIQLALTLPPELEKFKSVILESAKPFIRITPQKNADLTLWQSKFGGLPYLPKTMTYPTDSKGHPLTLLAQINFEEMPDLDPFPTKGILQFYIADDDLFGLHLKEDNDFEALTVQKDFRVLYFPETTNCLDDLTTDFSFLPEFEMSPVESPCALQFEKAHEIVPMSDYEFDARLGEDFFAQFGDKEDDIAEKYDDLSDADGSKLGGYAFFTQYDPRADMKLDNPYILLLQIDTNDEADIMWGDSGVGNFFIELDKLKQGDFSKVAYTWDCH